ncbi:MAG: PIN domain-containing protein [bacterium]
MNRCFVDTNLFLRFLTNDIPEQAVILEKLIEQSRKGKVHLVINTVVIAEIVWTLQSFYKYSKEKIDEIVSSIVACKAFEIQERNILLQALEDFHTLNIDFVDAYVGNWMKENKIFTIYTLNKKDFQRISGLSVM